MDNFNTKNTKVTAGSIALNGIYFWTSQGENLYDVTQSFNSCVIFEDIFSPFISGKLVLIDKNDIMNSIPLIGQETVYFSFATPYDKNLFASDASEKFTLSGEFMVSSIDKRTKISDKNVRIELSFVSKEAFYDVSNNFSMGFIGTPSDIAYNILKSADGLNTPKNVVCENTINQIQYVSNFWSPIKNINYLCENSINENNSPSFVFFENKNGFNYLSIDSLISPENKTNKNTMIFKVDRTTQDFESNTTNSNFHKDYATVKKINYGQIPSVFKRANRGFLGATIISPDVLNQGLGSQTKTIDYEQNFNSIKNHLNDNKKLSANITQSHNAKIFTLLRQTNQENNVGSNTSPPSIDQTIEKNTTLLSAEEEKLKNIHNEINDLNKKKEEYISSKKSIAEIDKELQTKKLMQTQIEKNITTFKTEVENAQSIKNKIDSDSAVEEKENPDGSQTKTKTSSKDGWLYTYEVVVLDGQIKSGKRTSKNSIENIVDEIVVDGDSISMKTSKNGTVTSRNIPKYTDDVEKTPNPEFEKTLGEFSVDSEPPSKDLSNDSFNGDLCNYNYFLERNMYISSFTDSSIEIEVNGRCDYSVGNIVQLIVPRPITVSKGDLKDDWMDKVSSGYYLITAIKHSILLNQHITTIELTSDSMMLSIK